MAFGGFLCALQVFYLLYLFHGLSTDGNYTRCRETTRFRCLTFLNCSNYFSGQEFLNNDADHLTVKRTIRKRKPTRTDFTKSNHKVTFPICWFALTLILLSNDIHLNPGPASPELPFNFSDSFFIDSSSNNLHNLHSDNTSTYCHLQESFEHPDFFDLPKQGIRLVSWNVQSLPNKLDEIKYILSDKPNEIDILGLIESHLCPAIDNNSLQLDGYAIERKDRNNKKGGGLLTYINNRLLFKRRVDLEDEKLEIIWLEIKTSTQSPTILTGFIYRPTSTDVQTDKLLMENINRAVAENRETWLLGDINIDLHNQRNLEHNFYKHMLSLGFNQLISSPTRIPSETCIDHIYTNEPSNVLSTKVPDIGLSDHRPGWPSENLMANSDNYLAIKLSNTDPSNISTWKSTKRI
ncbi:uncharacterized protein LOC116292996 [Actinia tenebrosa]|uniref:Uncharacterized protein LOC116292996 n=1 Tax=Actinia tenebrosa TaxID=6105 RepID=A0A6P8HU49_ACTTE|nr:uncharacterized protein LOC116292996 [Actinia tenebrosa]